MKFRLRALSYGGGEGQNGLTPYLATIHVSHAVNSFVIERFCDIDFWPGFDLKYPYVQPLAS